MELIEVIEEENMEFTFYKNRGLFVRVNLPLIFGSHYIDPETETKYVCVQTSFHPYDPIEWGGLHSCVLRAMRYEVSETPKRLVIDPVELEIYKANIKNH